MGSTLESFCSVCSNQKNPNYFENNENLIDNSFSDQRKTIAFAGPQKSGKSSIIYYLKNKVSKKTYQKTEAIEQTDIEFQGYQYELKEVPNQLFKIKPDAFVYVYDSNTGQDFLELNQFLSNIDKQIPVLLFLNKCDLVEESFDSAQINFGKDRKYHILKSNNKGEGVEEGFDWLTSVLKPSKLNQKKSYYQYF